MANCVFRGRQWERGNEQIAISAIEEWVRLGFVPLPNLRTAIRAHPAARALKRVRRGEQMHRLGFVPLPNLQLLLFAEFTFFRQKNDRLGDERLLPEALGDRY